MAEKVMDDKSAYQATIMGGADENTSNQDVESKEVPRTSSYRNAMTLLGCYLANFSDGFQNNLANNTNVIFNHLYGTKVYNSTMQTRISNSVIVGAIIGVLVLGYLSDMYSRRSGLFLTSGLVCIGTLMATLFFQVHGSTNAMLWYLIVSRGIAGFGVGGEYPPSAAAGLEQTEEHMKRYRGPIFVSFTTLMATTGGPVCTLVYLIALVASNNNLHVAFHAIYSVATILPLIILCLRFSMTDSTLFAKSNFKRRRPPYLLLIRRYWRRIALTSTAFFLYDFINFPNSIMSSSIINSLVKNKDIRVVAIWQVILAVLPIPGVLVGAWLTNAIGRRYTGVLGFLGYVVLGFIIGGIYTPLSKHIAAFVVLYGLLQALGHAGPGATIGLICSESYPTAMRGEAYAISTAFGRAGAAIGTEVFLPIQNAAGKASTFYVAGGVGLLGCLVYWFLPEGRDLDLETEDRELREYLKERGYDMDA